MQNQILQHDFAILPLRRVIERERKPDCGAKATVNARLDSEGCIVTEGAQLLLGGNDRYLAMCHKCWIRNIREHRKVKNR